MNQPAMTCAEAEPLLPLVADGAVDPDSDPALFLHLAGCPACQRIVAEHDLVSLALQSGHLAAAPPRRATILRFWVPAAAACLACAAGVLVWQNGRAVTAPPAAVPMIAKLAAAAVTPAPVATAAADRPILRLTRPDGSAYFLVLRDGQWQPLDPAALDGPVQQTPANNDGIQVRY